MASGRRRRHGQDALWLETGWLPAGGVAQAAAALGLSGRCSSSRGASAVAFTYAASYPEHVKRLVIEDSAPLPQGRMLTELWTSFASRAEVEQSVRAANPTMSDSAARARVDVYYRPRPDGTWGFRADVVGVRHGRGAHDAEKSWAHVRKILAPTLVIRAGAEPALVSHETAERLIRENPRIQVVTVPGAGHNIHFAHFDEFMAHLRQALSQPVGPA